MTVTYQTVILNQEQQDAVLVPAGNNHDPAATRPARILALDLSTGGRGSEIGWCAAVGHAYQESGAWQPPGRRAYDRLAPIARWLESLLEDWLPDWLVVEEPMGDHGNRKTDRALGMVVGIALECARREGCRFYLVHPSRVKATGLYKGATFEAAAFVDKDTVTPDEADAIGLWQAATVVAWKGESLL